MSLFLFLFFLFASTFNNTCLLHHLEIPEGPQTFDACKFVVETTDELWNLKTNTAHSMRKYFSPDYVIQSAGSVVYGLPGLAYYTYSTMLAFPDIKIKILDCFCKGNDIYGYRCSMPDILMGTNTGPSLYGAPTGKFVKYTGLVNSFIQNVDGRWVYMMEYGNHDVVTLLRELGFENLPPERPAEDYIQFVDNERCENWMTFFQTGTGTVQSETARI